MLSKLYVLLQAVIIANDVVKICLIIIIMSGQVYMSTHTYSMTLWYTLAIQAELQSWLILAILGTKNYLPHIINADVTCWSA